MLEILLASPERCLIALAVVLTIIAALLVAVLPPPDESRCPPPCPDWRIVRSPSPRPPGGYPDRNVFAEHDWYASCRAAYTLQFARALRKIRS